MEARYGMTVVDSTISRVFVMSWPSVCPQLAVLAGTRHAHMACAMLITKILLTSLLGVLGKATISLDCSRSSRTTIA